MTHAKHRKPRKLQWRFWYMLGLTTTALGVIAACAASIPTAAQGQTAPQGIDWKPMAVPGLEYACDPVLGVIVKHEWYQLGGGDGNKYSNWTITVTPYSQLSPGQRDQMCGAHR